MTNKESAAQERLAKLQAEHRDLTREVEDLREFMQSMTRLIEAAESPQRETEALSLLEQVLDNAIRAIGAKDGSLLVPDDNGELVFVLVRGESPKGSLIGRRLPANKGIAGWVAANRRATIVNNVPVDDRFYPELDVELDYRTNSLLAAPLIGGGQMLGVIEVINKANGKLFSTGNQTLLTLMCRFAGELLYSMITDANLTQNVRSARRA
ncbi:MAG: GAF domain-containing protein [Gammaproteobacteria bacterium]|nr:GAF domain-containing protein [Gammaproteobacteria bacterium]